MSEIYQYQFEEPLLESLYQILQEDLERYLKVVGVQSANEVLAKCGNVPANETLTFDFDASKGLLPAIVLTHSSSETTFQTNSGNRIAVTKHKIEIDFLSKISNDLCDVIAIHRVGRALKLLLIGTNKTIFGRYYRADNLINISLNSKLDSNALFLEQQNKSPLRGVRVFAEFTTKENGFKVEEIPLVQS